MKKILAIRHVAFEDVGSFAVPFGRLGFEVSYRDAGTDDLKRLSAEEPDLVVLLGGPIGACDEAEYPFVLDELRIAEARLKKDLPLLGICLGAQIMARALGACVYPGPRKEIGWKPLTLTAARLSSPVRHLSPTATSMFHWHGDTFDLPSGATLLASTDICANQAYSWGSHALAFQCHPELVGARIEPWLLGHACELAQNSVQPSTIRRETQTLSAALEAAGQSCLEEWLRQMGLV
ncbi:MAG TPA: glutamine amidotransferase [Acidisarcina sp.]|nr:glutamine amidotransferase [Acidisarcina sp.]